MNQLEMKKKLDKIANSLNNLLSEIKIKYPNAEYYVNSNVINIMNEGEILVDSKNINYLDVGSW